MLPPNHEKIIKGFIYKPLLKEHQVTPENLKNTIAGFSEQEINASVDFLAQIRKEILALAWTRVKKILPPYLIISSIFPPLMSLHVCITSPDLQYRDLKTFRKYLLAMVTITTIISALQSIREFTKPLLARIDLVKRELDSRTAQLNNTLEFHY